MKEVEIIDITPENISEYGVCGYKNANKHVELRKKLTGCVNSTMVKNYSDCRKYTWILSRVSSDF